MSKYSALRKQYSDFTIPAYTITIDNTKITDFLIDDIAVDNGMGTTAGACRFTAHDIYEHGSGSFSASALGSLKPGGKISVSLGYGSSVSEVFSGYIDELGMNFNEDNISLSAVCLDARALMREGAAYIAAKGKPAKTVLEAILDEYSPLISSKSVTLAALENEVNVTQAGGDLEYVQHAADLRGYYFFIDCGAAYIGEAKTTVCLEFDWPEVDIDFNARYKDVTICGMGYDHANMESFTAESSAKGTQKDLLAVTKAIQLPPHLLGDSGTAVVKAAAKLAKRETASGIITCRGIPEPKLGEKITINSFPLASLSGSSFCITSISHRMSSEDGFTTEIGIGGIA